MFSPVIRTNLRATAVEHKTLYDNLGIIIITVLSFFITSPKTLEEDNAFRKQIENNTKDKLNFGFIARHNHEALTVYKTAFKVMKNMTNLQCFLRKLGNNFILSECSRG